MKLQQKKTIEIVITPVLDKRFFFFFVFKVRITINSWMEYITNLFVITYFLSVRSLNFEKLQWTIMNRVSLGTIFRIV